MRDYLFDLAKYLLAVDSGDDLARRRGLTGCGRAGAAIGATSYSGGTTMEALALFCNHKTLEWRM